MKAGCGKSAVGLGVWLAGRLRTTLEGVAVWSWAPPVVVSSTPSRGLHTTVNATLRPHSVTEVNVLLNRHRHIVNSSSD